MKSTHVRLSLLAAALVGAAAIPATAAAEVSASAGVSNMYLWRGFNLGGGAPAVFGGLEYTSEVGAYAGAWGSSSGPVQEVDLYAGFRGGDEFTYDIAYYDYAYPSEEIATINAAPLHTNNDNRMYDWEEVIVKFGFSGVTLDLGLGMGDSGGFVVNADNENKTETKYVALGYNYEKFSVKYGMWDGLVDEFDITNTTLEDANFSHLDVGYKYNDNLSFTVSKIVNDDDKVEDDALFQLSYTLPLDIKPSK